MQDLTKDDIRRAALFIADIWAVDKRVRWFARIRRRWVPLTAVYRKAARLGSCHSYRAQGALETMGFRVRRFKPRTARRLQEDLILNQ